MFLRAHRVRLCVWCLCKRDRERAPADTKMCGITCTAALRPNCVRSHKTGAGHDFVPHVEHPGEQWRTAAHTRGVFACVRVFECVCMSCPSSACAFILHQQTARTDGVIHTQTRGRTMAAVPQRVVRASQHVHMRSVSSIPNETMRLLPRRRHTHTHTNTHAGDMTRVTPSVKYCIPALFYFYAGVADCMHKHGIKGYLYAPALLKICNFCTPNYSDRFGVLCWLFMLCRCSPHSTGSSANSNHSPVIW